MCNYLDEDNCKDLTMSKEVRSLLVDRDATNPPPHLIDHLFYSSVESGPMDL